MNGQTPALFNFATDVMEQWARLRPHDLALWCVGKSGEEQRSTFAELAEQFRRAASFFATIGIQRGDRVLVILPRVPEWWIAMLGLTKLGAVPIPGTVLLTSKDIRYRIEAAEVAAVITCSEIAERADDFAGLPRLVLAPGNATLAEEFSNLTWARELKDGRLIVTDGRDGRIVVADLRTGRVEPISRKGEGPGEYPRALPVWSIGGDSSAIIDGPRRWLIFDGDRVTATLAQDLPAVAAAKGTPRGADTLGHVFTAAFVPGQGRPIGDSTALLRVSRSTGRADTLTMLKALLPRQTSQPDAKGFFEFVMPTIGTADEATPFADGWVAVVRTDPYRVDWRSRDGSWIHGRPLPVPVVKMDDAEKRAYVQRVAKATGRPAATVESIADWPAAVPPYRSPALLFASPDGRVIIPRLASADHPETRYDVVNRQGVLDGQLIMSPNERIVSLGAKSVYVAVTDDDGIQRLRRHPWPPTTTR